MAACQTVSCLHAVDPCVGPMLVEEAQSFLQYIRQHVEAGFPNDKIIRRLVIVLGYMLKYGVDVLEQHATSPDEVKSPFQSQIVVLTMNQAMIQHTREIAMLVGIPPPTCCSPQS